ncbi:hypothetical protein A2U01_0117545, partial [Trifolium medium]|nr:hypothetical protein [Trifolium medium]
MKACENFSGADLAAV